jgi:phosphatidylserine/phosphatidylglycerophosphate/cardiolipin synthase-like enzyme
LSWDPNNALVIRDQALAKAYLHEFNEMWGGGEALPNSILSRTGDEKLDDSPHLFNIGGRHVEVYFSPSDDTNARILEAIHSAESSVDVALLLLTRNDLTGALISKWQDGVSVRVIVNDLESSETSFQTLTNAGVPAALHILNPIFHHKYAIVDEGSETTRILTGSHNWTTSATTINDENLLIIHDRDIANIYRQEYEARWAEVFTTGTIDERNISVQIVPNPVDDMLYLDSQVPVEALRVTSVVGQVLLASTVQNSIDVSSLTSGLYFLSVEMQDGKLALLPFVKR